MAATLDPELMQEVTSEWTNGDGFANEHAVLTHRMKERCDVTRPRR